MRNLVVLVLVLVVTPVLAGGATLQLNEQGVAGLEQMLDIARRNAPTMRDADMAVSLYNALQQAKVAQANAEAQKAAADEKARKDLTDQVEKLKADIKKAQEPPKAVPSTTPNAEPNK